MTLIMADGSTILSPFTRAWIIFGNYQIHHVVAVAEEAPEEVLLELDIGFLDYLLELAKDNNNETKSMEQNDDTIAEKVSATRVQTANELAEERDDIILSDESGAFPFRFSDDLFSSDACIEQDVNTVPNGLTIDLPLFTLCTYSADRDTFITQQELDESLGKLRQMADRGEMGYTKIDGVLIHRQELEGGQEFDPIVVPKPSLKEVLKLAHSSRLSGHFPHRKTLAAPKCQFTWPGISKEVMKGIALVPNAKRQGGNHVTEFHYIPYQ